MGKSEKGREKVLLTSLTYTLGGMLDFAYRHEFKGESNVLTRNL
jgi:hypothetical protein